VTKRAILDTGPLVAFLDRSEKHHDWVVEQVQHLMQPLIVCEAVLAETLFLLKRSQAAQAAIFALLKNGALHIQFSLAENVAEVEALIGKYFDHPISLADACIIRMAELNKQHAVFTLDSDFDVYRKHGREPIKLIAPSNTQKR
jgi:predicted nucleic acid-binding protein